MAGFNNLLEQQRILQRQDLTSTEKFVAIVILSFRNSQNGRCNPPIVSKTKGKETVCTRTGFSDVCVQKAIKGLEQKGVFTVSRELGQTSFFEFTGTNEVSTGTNEVSKGCEPRFGGVLTTLVHNKEITKKEQRNNKEITSKDVIVETAVSDPQPSESEKVEKPKNGIDCPYQKIVSDYNTILGPYLGMCQKLTPTRQKAVRARWLDCMKDGDFKTQEDGIAYFKRYFEYVKKCDFLMGNNGRDWRADFDWIFKQQNYTKICEGKYLSR